MLNITGLCSGLFEVAKQEQSDQSYMEIGYNSDEKKCMI